MDPTCHALTSLLPVSPGDARFAVMAPTPPESVAWPSRNVAACSAVGGVAKSTTPLSRARHLPHFSLRLASLSFSFPGRHERRVSKLTVSSRFASSAPRIPNPLHPKLLHLSSVLPNPSNPSHDPCFVENQKIPGRPPLKPLEALVAVVLPPPAVIFFVQ